MLIAMMLLILCQQLYNKTGRRIERVIKAMLVWTIWAFTLVEVLSINHLLKRAFLLLGWGIFDFTLAGMLLFQVLIKGQRIGVFLNAFPQRLIGRARNNKLLFITGIIVLILSLVTVPYNWDSMTYHLPRMMHWVQNRSVEHYASNDVRQLASPVLAEFINVQVYLLLGKQDMLWNLLQSLAYLFCAWMVYEISMKIGASKKFASLATLLFMMMPIAFAEALNTQVDLFATIWLMIFVYYFIDLFEAEKITANKAFTGKVIIEALCIAFGYLAKPSVSIGMAMLLLVLLLKRMKRRDKIVDLIKICLTALPVICVPLIPECVRNYHTFSAFSDPGVGARQLVGTVNPRYIFINFLKNFAHNWPNVYLYESQQWMGKIIEIIASVLRVNINDPAISEDGMQYVMNSTPSYGHDTATNPLVVILATLCFIWCLFQNKRQKSVGNRYSIYCMSMFLLFCAVLRWEPYVSRYMVAYLALLCPMIGYQIQTIPDDSGKTKIKNAVLPIVYFLCITELISLTFFHQERWHEDAMRRPIGYFASNKGIRPEYDEVLALLNEKGYHQLGIKLGGMNYEYPIWVMLNNRELHVENILVENDSCIYEDFTYIPDCILLNAGDAKPVLEVHGQTYIRLSETSKNKYLVAYAKE